MGQNQDHGRKPRKRNRKPREIRHTVLHAGGEIPCSETKKLDLEFRHNDRGAFAVIAETRRLQNEERIERVFAPREAIPDLIAVLQAFLDTPDPVPGAGVVSSAEELAGDETAPEPAPAAPEPAAEPAPEAAPSEAPVTEPVAEPVS